VKKGEIMYDKDGSGVVNEQKVDKSIIHRVKQTGFGLLFRWSAFVPEYLEEWNVFHKT